MRMIIAGGSGLIGRAFSQVAMKEGHQVVVLSRNPSSISQEPGVEFLGWNPELEDSLVLEGFDAVVNLAGENIGAGRWTPERKKSILQSRLKAGRTLLSAVRRSVVKPSVFLQASAIGYYGKSLEQSFTENSSPGDDEFSQICVQWENSTRAIEELGVRRIITRNGLVLDRKVGVLPKLKLPFDLMVGGPLGSGKQWYSWIHKQDIARALLFLIENPSASGAFNLTGPEPMRMGDFGNTMANVLKRPYWIPVPGFALKLVLGEMSTLVLDGQKVLPQRLLEHNFTFEYPKLKEALEAIYS